MAKVTEDAYHPPAPSQFGVSRAHVTGRGEPTGMLFCPWKSGQIALMRCGEWRGVCGQSATCPTRAGEEALAEARASMGEPVAYDSLSRRGGVTKIKAPNWYYQNVLGNRLYGTCRVCADAPAAYRKTGECMSCYGRRRYGHKKRESRG